MIEEAASVGGIGERRLDVFGVALARMGTVNVEETLGEHGLPHRRPDASGRDGLAAGGEHRPPDAVAHQRAVGEHPGLDLVVEPVLTKPVLQLECPGDVVGSEFVARSDGIAEGGGLQKRQSL